MKGKVGLVQWGQTYVCFLFCGNFRDSFIIGKTGRWPTSTSWHNMLKMLPAKNSYGSHSAVKHNKTNIVSFHCILKFKFVIEIFQVGLIISFKESHFLLNIVYKSLKLQSYCISRNNFTKLFEFTKSFSQPLAKIPRISIMDGPKHQSRTGSTLVMVGKMLKIIKN